MAEEPASMSVLNLDCLREVLKHLPIQEAIQLRPVCQDWDLVICERLRMQKSLKVFNTWRSIKEYYFVPFIAEREVYPFLRISDRPKDDDVILLGSNFSPHKLSLFSSFVYTKMPNITKLLLHLDSVFFKWLNYLDAIIDSVPKIETLFLANSRETPAKPKTFIKAFRALNRSIRKRKGSLKEFFFCPSLVGEESFRFDDHRDRDYVLTGILQGLQLLYTNSLDLLNVPAPLPSIKEIFLNGNLFPTDFGAFPNLEILRYPFYSEGTQWLDIEQTPNLKCLQFVGEFWEKLSISPAVMVKLNSFSKLEELNCPLLEVDGEYSDPDNFPARLINRTITHVHLSGELHDEADEEFVSLLPIILKAFAAMERLTITHGIRDEQEKQMIRDNIPGRITVKFVYYDEYRFMGKFGPFYKG